MSDTAFYVFISAVCLQILVMVSFYFTTYQRLFFTPGTGNVLPFVKCLRRCGPEATDLLRIAATDEDPSVSREAGDALAEIQPELALA